MRDKKPTPPRKCANFIHNDPSSSINKAKLKPMILTMEMELNIMCNSLTIYEEVFETGSLVLILNILRFLFNYLINIFF